MLHHVPCSRPQHHHRYLVQSWCSGQLISNSQEDVVKALKLISPWWAMAIIKIHLTITSYKNPTRKFHNVTCCNVIAGFFYYFETDEIYILVHFNILKTSWHWQFYNVDIITWMPWTFAFKAATRRSVLEGLMSPRSNFLLTKRRGMESTFQPLDLFGLLETNSGSLPLSTAHRRKTRWRSTYDGESRMNLQQQHQSLLYTFHNNGCSRFLPHQPFDQRFQLVSPETLGSLLWTKVWLHFLILWGLVIFQKAFYFPVAHTHWQQFIKKISLFHERLWKPTKKSNGMFPGFLGRWERITFSRSAELAALVPITTIKEMFCKNPNGAIMKMHLKNISWKTIEVFYIAKPEGNAISRSTIKNLCDY